MNRSGIAEASQVLGKCLVLEGTGRNSSKESGFQIELDIVADQGFWEGCWLDQKEPMPIRCRKFLCHGVIQLVGGYDVQNRQLFDCVCAIQNHPVSDPSTTVMTDHGKLLEAQTLHYFHLILCHGPFRVSEMVFSIRGLAAVTV